MIRDAVKEDIPQLIELGRAMHAEARRLNVMKYVPARVFVTLSSLIDSPEGFVKVVERDGELIGGLAAMARMHWFSTDRIACDLALFIRPDRRGGMTAALLLKEYKEWAKQQEVKLTQFTVSTGVHIASTGGLLERVGFKPAGFVFDTE